MQYSNRRLGIFIGVDALVYLKHRLDSGKHLQVKPGDSTDNCAAKIY